MKIYLIPPSESKQQGGTPGVKHVESIFDISVPVQIAQSATEKDLKCTGKRYEEAMQLNNYIYTSPVMPAIERYTGVMYGAMNYESMSLVQQEYFDQHIYILSGLRGILRPTDMISNYKLPLNTTLAKYWRPHVTKFLVDLAPSEVVSLLPGTYMKMIDWKALEAADISVHIPEFRKPDGSIYTHGIKKVRGEWMSEQMSSSI